MTSTGGRLTPDVTRVSLLETRAACCRNSNSQLEGQPGRSLAHSFSEWLSTKTPSPWRMSPKTLAPRPPPGALWAPASVMSLNFSGRCHRKPSTSSLSMRLAPAATGSIGIYGKQTTLAGWWRLPSFPHRRVSGSQRTAGTRGNWLASRAGDLTAVSILLRGATPTGLHYPGGQHPSPTRPGRRRLGLPVSRQGQAPFAPPAGKTAQSDPRPQLEGPRQTV
jgi:hypothetical protein